MDELTDNGISPGFSDSDVCKLMLWDNDLTPVSGFCIAAK